MKKLLTIAAALLVCGAALAQSLTGGIKASVVNRAGRAPIPGAKVELFQAGESIATANADSKGAFLFDRLSDGNYNIRV